MRVFSAIPFPDEVKEKTGELLKGRLPVHYVNINNLHITLNFFGELDTDQVIKLQELFAKVLQKEKSFPVEFDRMTKFYNQIHMTLKPNEALTILQGIMEKEFAKYGFRFDDRQYYPHVKLANMHMDKVMNMSRKIENFRNEELQQLNFIANKVGLYESKLLLHHAHHYSLVEVQLS